MIPMSKKEIEENKTAPASEKTEAAAAKKPKNLKKFKYGSMSIIIICLVVAIVVVINFMASMLSKRYPIKIDLTPDKRYELSDESIDILKGLSQDVEITVTTPKDTFESMTQYYERMYGMDVPYNMIPVILEKYQMYAEQSDGSVTVKYVDMDKDPDVISKYSKYYNGEITSGNIVIYSKERVKVIDSEGVFGMLQNSAQNTQSQTLNLVFAGESTLTSAIMSVTDSHPVSAAFVKTMNGQAIYSEEEYGSAISGLETILLERNGYDCTDIDIETDELNADDYDMLVLAVPSSDMTEDIITKMSDFLYNGGNYGKSMLYIPSLSHTEFPNLDEFLADWSIQVEKNIVVDNSYYGTSASIVLSMNDTEAIGVLPNEALPIVAPYTRELTILSKNNEDVVSAVLTSSSTSFTTALSEDGTSSEDQGARNAAVLTKKQHAEGLSTYTSSVLVLGSSLMTEEELLTQNTTYNNANVLLNILNNMTGKENGAVIPEKSLQQSYIATDEGQSKAIQIVVIWVIPFIVAAIGVFVLLRRRNR